jgi:hypothetical protein
MKLSDFEALPEIRKQQLANGPWLGLTRLAQALIATDTPGNRIHWSPIK